MTQNRWKDVPDYILGVTREIWEDRGIATLHQSYAPDIIVRSPASIVTGNTGVIAATMATLAEFPDRTLLGEDVIYSGSLEEGFLSSHRIVTTATHSGNGVYGAATGKKLTYRIIADCAGVGAQINDEWLIRDQGAIVRQLGWDPRDYAAHMIEVEGGPEQASQPFHPSQDRPGPYLGRGNDHETGSRYSDILTRIMEADMAAIPAEYDRAVQSEHPGGVTGHGCDPVDQFWMGLRASFPSATFEIHHQIGRDDPMMPPRAALRWSITGKHDGWGMFGKPTGAEVHIMGLSHAEFGPYGLKREFVVFDEPYVWKQILLHSG